MDGWMDGWVGGWMDGWMDGLVGGWMDGWMGGWMDITIRIYCHSPMQVIPSTAILYPGWHKQR